MLIVDKTLLRDGAVEARTNATKSPKYNQDGCRSHDTGSLEIVGKSWYSLDIIFESILKGQAGGCVEEAIRMHVA